MHDFGKSKIARCNMQCEQLQVGSSLDTLSNNFCVNLIQQSVYAHLQRNTPKQTYNENMKRLH